LNQNWFVDLRHTRGGTRNELFRRPIDQTAVQAHCVVSTRQDSIISRATGVSPTPAVSVAAAWTGSDVQEPRSASL